MNDFITPAWLRTRLNVLIGFAPENARSPRAGDTMTLNEFVEKSAGQALQKLGYVARRCGYPHETCEPGCVGWRWEAPKNIGLGVQDAQRLGLSVQDAQRELLAAKCELSDMRLRLAETREMSRATWAAHNEAKQTLAKLTLECAEVVRSRDAAIREREAATRAAISMVSARDAARRERDEAREAMVRARDQQNRISADQFYGAAGTGGAVPNPALLKGQGSEQVTERRYTDSAKPTVTVTKQGSRVDVAVTW